MRRRSVSSWRSFSLVCWITCQVCRPLSRASRSQYRGFEQLQCPLMQQRGERPDTARSEERTANGRRRNLERAGPGSGGSRCNAGGTSWPVAEADASHSDLCLFGPHARQNLRGDQNCRKPDVDQRQDRASFEIALELENSTWWPTAQGPTRLSGRGAPLGNRRAWKHGVYAADMRALRRTAHALIASARLALKARSGTGALIGKAERFGERKAEMPGQRLDRVVMGGERVGIGRADDDHAKAVGLLAHRRQHRGGERRSVV